MQVDSSQARAWPRSGRWLARVVCVVAVLGVASPAAAQPQKDEAESLIKQGLELRRQGQNLEALPYFQRAFSLYPTSRSGAQLGFVEQAVGLSLEAERHISAALADEGDVWVRRNKTAIVQALAEIRGGLGRLTIQTIPAGVGVTINGVPVPPRELQNPIYVKPGSSFLEFRQPGFVPQSRSITVLAGTTQQLAITLQPGLPPSSREPPAEVAAESAPSTAPSGIPTDVPGLVGDSGAGKRTGAVVLASMAALALVGGTTCLLIANNKVDDIEKDARSGARYNVANGNYPTLQRASQVLYGAAGASLLVGGLLFFTTRPAAAEQAHLAPALMGPRTPGLALTGAF